MDNVLDKRIIKSVSTFKQALIAAGYKIDGVYIFGSQAKGGQHQWSDIDVAVVSPDFNDETTNYFVKLSQLSWKIDEAIEPHAIHPDELKNKYSTFAHEVKKYGIAV